MSQNAHRSVRLDIWVEISIVEPSELGGMDNKFSESALIPDRAIRARRAVIKRVYRLILRP